MLNRLAIKKNHLLIAAAIVAFLASYQLAFKNTLSAWSAHRQLQQQLAQGSSLDYQPGYLDRKRKNLDRLIAGYRVDSAMFRTTTINQISALAEDLHLKIVNLPLENPDDHSTRFIVQRLELEGNYFSLLKLARQIEQLKGCGLLRSVEIKSKPPGNQPANARNNDLTMSVWLAMIK